MEVKQKEVIEMAGFVVSPDFYTRPRTTYYGIDNMGNVKVMPNLPNDAASLAYYLKVKGYVLDPKDLPQSVAVKAQEGFACEDCGKVLSSKLALAGHKRTHKK